jgi:GntR family transcriptional regulator
MEKHNISLNRNASLAEQVKKELISLIGFGEIANADGKLPSEPELSEIFGVSRSTIRVALASLDDAGIIFKQHGVGTYVADLKTSHGSVLVSLSEFAAFQDAIESSGSKSETNLISLGIVKVGSSSSALKVHSEESAIRIHKVVSSSGTPVIYSDAIVPFSVLQAEPPGLDEIRDCCIESVYSLLTNYSSYSFRHQATEITSLLASDEIANHLKYQVGQPLLLLEEIGLSHEGIPLFHGMNYFRADKVTFRTVRSPLMSIASDPD